MWGWDYLYLDYLPECVRGEESSDSLTETAVRMGDLGEGRQIPFSFASLDRRLWMGDDAGLGVFRDALCTVVGVADSDATCSVGHDSNVSFAYSSATELSTLSLPDSWVLEGGNITLSLTGSHQAQVHTGTTYTEKMFIFTPT